MPTEQEPNSMEEKRVLIVDSNAVTQQARAKVLRAHGVHVQTADSIHQAELLWSPGLFNLIMLDLRENGADAMAFWRKVKRESPRQHIVRLGGPFVLRQAQHSRAA